MRGNILAITKWEIEYPEESESSYECAIIRVEEILAQHVHKRSTLPSMRDNRDVIAESDAYLGQIEKYR